MFGSLPSLFRQDMKIVLRNGFHFVIIFLVLLIVPVIRFAVPARAQLTPTELILDETADKRFSSFLKENGVEDSRMMATREELLAAVGANQQSIGIIFAGSLEKPKFTIVRQGAENKVALGLLEVTLDDALRLARGDSLPYQLEARTLRPAAPPVPFNKSLIPLVLAFEVVLFGFILIAVMVFQEKQEGTIRSFRVTPSRTTHYILSKALVNLLLSTAYGVLLVLFTMGPRVNWAALAAVILPVSFLMTLVSLSVSVFFNSISDFIFAALLILFVFSLPGASYVFPSFAPTWLTWIPSYPVAFGVREILFPTGKSGYLGPMLITLLLQSAAFLLLAHWTVRSILFKGRRY